MLRAAEPLRDADARPESDWRALHWMACSRVAVALVLALAALAPLTDSQRVASWLTDSSLFGRVAGAYLLAAIVFVLAIRPLRPNLMAQLVVHTLTDLFALTVMMNAAGGLRGGLGVLMVAVVAAAAVLSNRMMALSFAAAASLMLLGESLLVWLRSDVSHSSLPMIAGLTGAACFVTAMLVNWLARQLRRQEALAQARGLDLRNQLAVTQLVVAELEQGVIVVAHDGRMRAMNRVAQQMLGHDRFEILAGACARWRDAGSQPDEQAELVLSAGERPLQVLLRFVAAPGEGDAVLMVEDLRRTEARAQQLKLAAMGRLSASIAHEIRNPLGAIRHANALLGERLDDAPSARLSRIIEDNTVRIDRVIADVLSVSRRDRPADESIEMGAFIAAFAAEFAAQAGVSRERIALRIESGRPMRFDGNHLRQVLVNLVGNALRYASQAPGAVGIVWRERPAHRLELRIFDDGPGLSTEMQQHAFEPFFTTENRGTGLGLYLARELCAANGASIRYDIASDGCPGAFVIEPRATTG